VVGVLAGIPPIVYAVSVLIFVQLFMVPKFAADSTFATFDPTRLGVQPQDWPPGDVPFSPGSFPWDLAGTNNSTLLGGVLIALLVIPFMTPLITDAMRNVPSASREASYALGANRGYTLRKVILPLAMPGMAAALALGALKALGDTLIVAFAVGWEANTVPNPIVDVLERTPSLAAQGAGLVGSFPLIGATCTPAQCAVGYSSALLLLVLAVAIVVTTSMLQARWRRRMAG
jgi:phosphate transport system permease protein